MTTLGLRTCMVERDELKRENEGLRALVVELGGDPDVLDLRDPERDGDGPNCQDTVLPSGA